MKRFSSPPAEDGRASLHTTLSQTGGSPPLSISREKEASPASNRVGWADPRHGVELKEGQQIFRTYKGKEYRATANDGFLVRTDNGAKCNSLNQLSRTIHSNVENAWNNWYVALKDGQRQLISRLRK